MVLLFNQQPAGLIRFMIFYAGALAKTICNLQFTCKPEYLVQRKNMNSIHSCKAGIDHSLRYYPGINRAVLFQYSQVVKGGEHLKACLFSPPLLLPFASQ
jgi:hypothetical protein